jgi:hypothetical protein
MAIFSRFLSQHKAANKSALGLALAITTFFSLLASDSYARPEFDFLRGEFGLEDDRSGSFLLDTDATNPTITTGALGQPEYLFVGAVNEFSLIQPGSGARILNEKAGWKIVTGIRSELIGLPPGNGVLAGVNYPNGCSTGTQNFCEFTLAVLYKGDLSLLPQLSNDPNDYQILGADDYDDAGNSIGRTEAVRGEVLRLPDSVGD